MFTQIYKKAATLCLLLVLASILACGICMVSAEESPYLDLENDPDVTLTYDEIADKQGIILNEAAIEPNLHVLSQYLHNDCGVILVPNRAPGTVLGWTLTSVNNGEYELSPFYLYNSDVDKNSVDYTEELSSLIQQSSSLADDFMSATISFSVYGTDWFQNQSKVATVYIRSSIDFYDIDNPNYSYFVGKYEVCVAPVAGTYLRRFNMALAEPTDTQHRPDKEILALNSVPNTETNGFSIGGSYTFPKDAPEDSEMSVSLSFNYSMSAPDGSVTILTTSTDTIENDSSFSYTSYRVSPSDSADDGDSYTGLMHVQYRVPSGLTTTGGGIVFYGLDLGGNIGKPGYENENTECAVIVNMWDPSFSERGIFVASGKSSNIPTDDVLDQGFGDYDVYSSLPNQSVLGPGLWFTD